MSMSYKRKLKIFSATILLTLGVSVAKAAICLNPSSNSVDCQMTKGARWEFAWTNDAKKGLVLKGITLTAKSGAPRTLVLQEASLAQLLVSYDNNSANQHYVSDSGLSLTALTAMDCPLPGKLLQNNGTGSALVCQVITPRGYAWRGSGQIQGESLVLFGVSAVGSDTYINQWIFNDDGSIQIRLGVSGQIDPSHDSSAATGWPIGISGATRYATNRYHTANWRLDFAVGGQDNDLFQQLDYAPLPFFGYIRNQTITNRPIEGQFKYSPENQRFWIIKDKEISNLSNGQKTSFQLVPHHDSLNRGGDAFTNFDVYVTQNKACEQFASHNPTTGGCGADLPSFVNGEAISDPVVWAGATWHQVPRAEDEADIKTHWQGIVIAPRDLTDTSPFN